jgi:hypothetical protein
MAKKIKGNPWKKPVSRHRSPSIKVVATASLAEVIRLAKGGTFILVAPAAGLPLNALTQAIEALVRGWPK